MVDGAAWEVSATPRAWQIEALTAWRAASDRGVVAVTTGSGKTFFAFLCILDLLSREPETSVRIVVPTLALLDQWYVGLQEDLGVADSQIAAYSGNARPSAPRRVNLLVINTARDLASQLTNAHDFLIVDECHRASGPRNVQALAGAHAATLGLSATPEGTYDNAFQERVSPKLGPIIYRYDYRSARADGVIVPFNLLNVRIPLTLAEQDHYTAYTRRLGKARPRNARAQTSPIA